VKGTAFTAVHKAGHDSSGFRRCRNVHAEITFPLVQSGGNRPRFWRRALRFQVEDVRNVVLAVHAERYAIIASAPGSLLGRLIGIARLACS